MRVALINVTASGGSGKFCVELCRQTMERGHTVLFCHARSHCPGDIPSCRVGWYSGTFAALRAFFGKIGRRTGQFFSLAARSLRLKREEKKAVRVPRNKRQINTAEMVPPVFLAETEEDGGRHSSGQPFKKIRRRKKARLPKWKAMDKGKATMHRAVHPKLEFIRSNINTYTHGLRARFTDRQGFYSKQATRRLVEQLRSFQPDVIHLHTLHGYYLHMPTLFAYLREEGLPVVWTLHDLWAVTGHCSFHGGGALFDRGAGKTLLRQGGRCGKPGGSGKMPPAGRMREVAGGLRALRHEAGIPQKLDAGSERLQLA